MNTFTASIPTPPENMSLKARLAYIYFFGDGKLNNGGWAVAHTADGCWIVTDEACSLETASVYPDDDSFTAWLEAMAEDHICNDRVEWFRSFVVVKELVDNAVAVAMERIVSV